LIGKGIFITSDGTKFIGYFNKDGKLIEGYVPMAKVEGRAKAETEKKAELKVKREAETAALLKAASEARKKAEAKKKAELEAKKEAETAALLKAASEARKKAEAKKKAELEAKSKTEPLATVKPEAEKVIEIDSKTEDRVKEITQAEAKAGPGKNSFTAPNGIKFIYISAGTFTMGSSKDESGRYDNETQHQVTLTQGFYMQITEVTQGQWRGLMGNNPSFFNGCGDDCPVEQVSWNDAQQFIWRLNQLEGADKYRLPTEAEWEYACRAGNTSAFASGEITALECEDGTGLDEVAWFCGNSAKTIHPVAKKKPNAWGLYDMHGNVSELCQDWYGEYPPDRITDPKGPASGIDRTVRGGGWKSQARHCRSACRGAVSSGQKIYDVGFRLVMMP
jgi:formylglycine-generating enzyme required for sulfatase activity